jgi:hypothetical protein
MNILKGVWADISKLWSEDISGVTLSEFSGGKKLMILHPTLSSFINYTIAVLRIILYWIGTGLIGIVGPVLGTYEIIVNWSKLMGSGATGIVGIVIFAVLVVLLETIWVIPYFISKAHSNTPTKSITPP